MPAVIFAPGGKVKTLKSTLIIGAESGAPELTNNSGQLESNADLVLTGTTQIFLPNGTSSNPAITFTGEPDCGIYATGGSNEFSLCTASTERMTIRNTVIDCFEPVVNYHQDNQTTPHYSHGGDSNSGYGFYQNDEMQLRANGSEINRITGTAFSFFNEQEIRLFDTTNGNYSGFKAPTTLTGNVTFVLPDGDGAAGTVLKTDGAATLSWGYADTIEAATPTLNFKDTDGTDADVNATIAVELSDTGSGTEDADMIFSGQVGGALTEFMRFDADSSSLSYLQFASSVDLKPASNNGSSLGTNTARFGDAYIYNLIRQGSSSTSQFTLYYAGSTGTPDGVLSSYLQHTGTSTKPFAIFTDNQTSTTDSNSVHVMSGNTADGDAGNVKLRAGRASGSGADGDLVIDIPSMGTSGHVLTSVDAAGTAEWAVPTEANEADLIKNVGIASSASAGALTVSLKQSDGSTDPSTGSAAATIGYRSATVTNGGYTTVSTTGSLSVVVPSGATLGYASGDDAYCHVYAINNAGATELAVCGTEWFRGDELVSTTAIGTGSDEGLTLYSTSARSNVPCRYLGYFRVDAITTAGTWTTPDAASVALPGVRDTEILTVQSSTKVISGSEDDEWLVMTGNSLTLPPGTWVLSAQAYWDAAGNTLDGLFLDYHAANGTGTTSAPSAITTIGTRETTNTRQEWPATISSDIRESYSSLIFTNTETQTVYANARPTHTSHSGSPDLTIYFNAQRIK